MNGLIATTTALAYVSTVTFIVYIVEIIFSLKNSRPCRDLNQKPPQYQANMLPTELSWLEFLLIKLTSKLIVKFKINYIFATFDNLLLLPILTSK